MQYAGRLAHSAQPKALIDYHDASISFLDRQLQQRKRFTKNSAILEIMQHWVKEGDYRITH